METFSSAIPDGNGSNFQSSVQRNQPHSSNILFVLYTSIHNEPIYLLLLCVDVWMPDALCALVNISLDLGRKMWNLKSATKCPFFLKRKLLLFQKNKMAFLGSKLYKDIKICLSEKKKKYYRYLSPSTFRTGCPSQTRTRGKRNYL